MISTIENDDIYKTHAEYTHRGIPGHWDKEKIVTGIEAVPNDRHTEDGEYTYSTRNSVENNDSQPS